MCILPIKVASWSLEVTRKPVSRNDRDRHHSLGEVRRFVNVSLLVKRCRLITLRGGADFPSSSRFNQQRRNKRSCSVGNE